MQELVLIQPVRTLQEESVGEAERLDPHEEFEARLLECGPLAYRVAQGVLRNTADAEDVAQEALLRAYRKFKRLRDPSRFRAWLVRIVYRLAPLRRNSGRAWRAQWMNCPKSCAWCCCSPRSRVTRSKKSRECSGFLWVR